MPKVPRHNTGVYQIRNKINGKVYIGGAYRTFKKRREEHFWDLRNGRHKNEHLQLAWDLYGEACFEFEIVERCSPEDVQSTEQAWIDSLSRDQRYNINPSASSAFLPGHEVCEETRQKIADSVRRHFANPAAKDSASVGKLILYMTERGKDIKKRLRDAAIRQFSEPAARQLASDSAKKRHREKPELTTRGESHGNALLTEEIVREARELRRTNPRFWTYKRLQKRYDCGFITIYKAVVGRTWRHVR